MAGSSDSWHLTPCHALGFAPNNQTKTRKKNVLIGKISGCWWAAFSHPLEPEPWYLSQFPVFMLGQVNHHQAPASYSAGIDRTASIISSNPQQLSFYFPKQHDPSKPCRITGTLTKLLHFAVFTIYYLSSWPAACRILVNTLFSWAEICPRYEN